MNRIVEPDGITHIDPRVDLFFGNQADYEYFIAKATATLIQSGIQNVDYAKAVAHSILAMYDGRHRRYHNYLHINTMFKYADEYFPNKGGNGNTLEPSERLAILFHDIVYIPHQQHNEERSVDMMIAFMAGHGTPLTDYSWSSRCIYATGRHLETVEDDSTYAVLDLDLVSLAEEWDAFWLDSLLLEEELGITRNQHENFFRKLLEKPKIYYRLEMLEKKARQNLQCYLEHYDEQDL
jgi:predicted metal-dependent HD superfamily phosphohydrolase